MGNMTVGLDRRRTYRAVEDVDSMGESGRDRGLDGLSGEFQGLEGPVCKFNNLLEAWRESSQQSHFLFFCFPVSLGQLQPAPRTKLGWRPLLVVLLRPHTRPRLSCFLFGQLNAIRIVVSFFFFFFFWVTVGQITFVGWEKNSEKSLCWRVEVCDWGEMFGGSVSGWNLSMFLVDWQQKHQSRFIVENNRFLPKMQRLKIVLQNGKVHETTGPSTPKSRKYLLCN